MKIAVIGAMDVEVENLKTTLNLKKEEIIIKNMHSIGDIIFGKVAGFKWWPGKITKIEKTKDAKKCVFRVDFFEEKKKQISNLHRGPKIKNP